MQKGQAFVLSGDTFLLPHGASLVLVPLCGNDVLSDLVSPAFESPLASGGRVSLPLLASKGIDKLHIVAKADVGALSFTFNDQVTVSPDASDEIKIWVLFTVYKHNDSWKVRLVSETVSGNDVLLKYLKIAKQIDLVSLCYKKYSARDTLKEQAGNIVNSRTGSQAREGAGLLARSLMNEGMSLFGRLKGKANNAVSHVKNQKFLDASCAASAVVAFADGYASPEEVSKLLSFIRSHDVLSIYSESEVKSSFEKFVSGMKSDLIIGEGKAMAAISEFSGKTESHIIVALAAGIAAAEMGVDDDEKEAIKRIGHKLSVDVTDILARV
jgi:tellurite resistance protein